jgi:hypothetical protein
MELGDHGCVRNPRLKVSAAAAGSRMADRDECEEGILLISCSYIPIVRTRATFLYFRVSKSFALRLT